MMKSKFKPGDALLIVDPQNDFMPNGALAVPEGDRILPIVNQWIAAAVTENIPVIISRDWHPQDHISFQSRGGRWPTHCVRNTHGAAFHTNLHVPTNAIIVNKAIDANHEAYSALQGVTDSDGLTLPEKLQQLAIQRLWVAGLALDYCVHFSALDAKKLGLEVHVILPACRAIAQDSEQQAFKDMVAVDIIIENEEDPYLNTQNK
ncbi:MAG: isochorismatase family protein [Coxiellaceae bacterium]|nr:MAG: isochorismatase family protein [Coxiellaceae bacterium]